MNNKKYDDFFDDLDKTTDLLKAFKPHVDDASKLDELDTLFAEINNQPKKVEPKKSTPVIDDKKQIKSSSKKETNNVKNTQTKRTIKEEPIKNNKNVVKQNREQTDIKQIMHKLSLRNENKVKPKKNEVTPKTNSEPKKVKRTLKPGVLELCFCGASLLFILGCMFIYGSRFVKYYRIYNPKSENGKTLSLLSTSLAQNSSLVYEGDGLYMVNGEYTYKGLDVNNYVMFSNMKWRIIKTNQDGTIDLILDDYINVLKWANRPKAYIESDIHKYLNDYFIKYLNKDYLTEVSICKDEVDDLKKFSCKNTNNDNFVRLPSVSDFLNSKVTASYMAANNDTLWLNTTSHNGTWQINGNNLSLATPDRALGIKPVIKLKSGIALISGKGTSDDPYIIEEDKKELQVGSFVALGKDIWTVYDIDKNNVRLVLNKYMDTTYRFDLASNIYNVDNANSLASYLNTTYYNSLSYKKDLKKVKWYTGEYNNSYKDIYNSSINAYVGIYNAADLKFNNELTNYLLMNGNSQLSYLYGNELVLSKPAIYRNIRPTISISKKEIKSGKGTLEKPYILED